MRKLALTVIMLAVSAVGLADVSPIGWPRAIQAEKGEVVIYQPQLDSFEGDELIGRAAVSVSPTGSDDLIFGVVQFESRMDTDRDERTMRIVDLDITQVGFADATNDQKETLAAFIESEILKWDLTLSLDRVLASLAAVQQEREAARGLAFDPPVILVAEEPSILVTIDGEPRFADLQDSKLERLVNSPFTIVRNPGKNRYYLDGGTSWYVADDVMGPWKVDKSPPRKIARLRSEEAEQAAREAAVGVDSRVPRIVVVTEPTELIVTDGPPDYEPVTIELLTVNNSDNDLLFELESQRYFVLLSGRWYSSASLDGPWEYVATENLPGSFEDIPATSAAGHLRAFVPGTEEAEQAVLDNQIPQTAAVKRGRADLTVEYDGEPRFEAIEGTGMEYALNTSDSVLRIDGEFWLCREGVWYQGPSAKGPWTVATHRPDDVESIPASNPHYNVKYVHVYNSTPDVVYMGYTPGYYGSYYYGGCVVYGTGWYYRPWYGRSYYPYHATWGFNAGYTPWSGWSVGLSWNSGPFTIGIGYGFGGGYRGYPYYGGGYWGPRYGYHGRGPINVGNVNIGNVNIGNVNRRGAASTRIGRDNLYNRPGNRSRIAQRPSRPAGQPTAVTTRANNVLAGRDGNVYRRSGDQWQRREGGDWKSAGGDRRAADRARSGNRAATRDRASDRSGRAGNRYGDLNRDYQARQRGNQWSTGARRGSGSRAYSRSRGRSGATRSSFGGARGGGLRRR
jgi:hypothetical protein